MSQGRLRQCLDVVGDHEVAASQRGQSLAGPVERQRASGRCSEIKLKSLHNQRLKCDLYQQS